MDWKRIAASVLMLGVLAVPASAASITPQTTSCLLYTSLNLSVTPDGVPPPLLRGGFGIS